MDLGLDLHSLAIISFGLAAGAFVKGLTGMGLPLVAVPFMASFLGAEHAIVVMQIPGLVSNGWLVWRHRRELDDLSPRYDMVIPAALFTIAGVWFLDSARNNVTLLLLAAVVGAFLALVLLKPSFRLEGKVGRIVTPMISAVGGFVQGAAGISGPLFSTLVLSFRLKKEAYVFYVALIFGLCNTIQVVVMAYLGMWNGQRIVEGLLAVIPMFVFQAIGMKLMGRVSPVLFNRAVITVILVMEIKLVWNGIYG